MNLTQLIENAIYFLVLINPVSKVFFLASQKPVFAPPQMHRVTAQASIISWIILITLVFIGDFLLNDIFHVKVYSLSVAGGIILFGIGVNAVKNESFNNTPLANSDITIVPLATPLIAGPGTMTATLTWVPLYGIRDTCICITLAILINYLCMLFAYPINRTLEKIRATSPIIRITGLLIATMAMQMIFAGCTAWVKELLQ